ncbi:class I SAM-dependent methyltransferase [Leucothrix mucor]|uniref:class I SAM-dependent methyltransferase n=1 Tax=Leucothrix mucor TaxID=45248 RepID=UPI0003B72AD2|nr:class I SAM-dependent methyltransferase [Leucothrix mucor]
MSDDFFQHKAAVYEQDERRVANVHTIAGSIIKRIALKPTMQLMDFGSGTGLLLGQIASHVAKITAVDISKSMNQQLRDKKDSLACEVEVLEMDLCTTDLDRKFDGIISSMTMHHVEDVPAMFEKFRTLLKPGGFIAIADLETEDGSFHTEDTGVFHNGFDGQALVDFATDAGFKQAEVALASTVHKPQGEYPVLLLTATID